MSKPTIKPRFWFCHACGQKPPIHVEGHRAPTGAWCEAKVEGFYGPDDLVAVVREVFAICNVEVVNGEVVTPEHIVERLTGVKR